MNKDTVIKALKKSIKKQNDIIYPKIYSTRKMGSFKLYTINDFQVVTSSHSFRFEFDGCRIIYKNEIQTPITMIEFSAIENIIKKQNEEIKKVYRKEIKKLSK